MFQPVRKRVSNGGQFVRTGPDALKEVGGLLSLARPNRDLAPQNGDFVPPAGIRVNLGLLVYRAIVCEIES